MNDKPLSIGKAAVSPFYLHIFIKVFHKLCFCFIVTKSHKIIPGYKKKENVETTGSEIKKFKKLCFTGTKLFVLTSFHI